MKINPNSFFKFNGEWHNNKNGKDLLCTLTIPYKDVKRLEILVDEHKNMHYNLFINFDDKTTMYSLTKKDYEKGLRKNRFAVRTS
jgi:hypothetical protein